MTTLDRVADRVTDGPRPTTRPPGLSVAEAARQLGISRHPLPSPPPGGPLAGGQPRAGWVAAPTAPTASAPDHPTASPTASDHATDDRVDLVTQLQSENAWLRGEVERRDRELTQAATEREQAAVERAE